jgi:tRNA dimethylallyltransferase
MRCGMDAITASGDPLLVGGTMLYFRALYRICRSARSQPGNPRGSTGGRPGLGACDRLAAIDLMLPFRSETTTAHTARAGGVHHWSISRNFSQPRGQTFPYRRFLDYCPRGVQRCTTHRRALSRHATPRSHRGSAWAPGAWDLDLDKPAIRAVGYRQVWEYLDRKVGYMK